MPIYARKKTGDYSTAPEGLWSAVCVDVVDLGIVKTSFGEKPQIKIVFQLEERDPKTDKRFLVSRRFTPSLHEKASLRQILSAWRGRQFTADEVVEFDVERLIGANAQVQVMHAIGDEGQVWANVAAVVPPLKNTVKLVAENYIREIDRPKEYGKHADGNKAADDSEWAPF